MTRGRFAMKEAGFLRGLVVAVLVLAVCAGPALALPDGAAIRATLEGPGALVLEGRTLDRAELRTLYEKRDFRPIWNAARRQSFRRALGFARSQGLDPADYAVLDVVPVDRELLLTNAFLRYARALARGRVAPTTFETDWRIPPPEFDPSKVLDAAIHGDVATVLAGLAPQNARYERLRAALQHYEAMAKRRWRPLRIALPLRPGAGGPDILKLRARLAADGFAGPATDDPSVYDESLMEAVSRFQAARGLTVDGKVGRWTLAALNVSPAWRARQIRLNLERWRSLPRIEAKTRVEVNVPAATATLYEDGAPVEQMRAIVGAVDHPTPVLRARITSVVFNPPWVVPLPILDNEIRPLAKRDPHYLERFGYAYEDIRGIREFVQLPGPKNALGRIKFEMFNPDAIYMHGTPDQNIFKLARRAYSHGCVRVEHPVALAQHLLASDRWSRAAIEDAIAAGATQSVTLPHPVPVYMLYWTAFVDPDGIVEFRDDIYGRDRRLAQALAAQRIADHLVAAGRNADKG